MAEGQFKDGIAGGRLPLPQYAENFVDLHPRLDEHEALVEADRCYFCHDAPCVAACPTGIDIPMFIREILTDNPKGAAETTAVTLVSSTPWAGPMTSTWPCDLNSTAGAGSASGSTVMRARIFSSR